MSDAGGLQGSKSMAKVLQQQHNTLQKTIDAAQRQMEAQTKSFQTMVDQAQEQLAASVKTIEEKLEAAISEPATPPECKIIDDGIWFNAPATQALMQMFDAIESVVKELDQS